MRVLADGNTSGIYDPCSNYAGEVEDYSVQINQTDSVYCIPVINQPCDVWIGNVTLGTIDNTSAQSTSCGAGGYTDYTSLSASVVPGQIVRFSLQGYGTSTQKADVYIDYNSDGDFADAGEHVAKNLFLDPFGNTVAGFFVVPLTQASGSFRIRVKSYPLLETPDACMNTTSGETEDYTLVVSCTGNGSGIVVKANSLVIADGDRTPSLPDFTDFGNLDLNATVTRTFTIENPIGSAGPLNLSGITIGGSLSTFFTVPTQPAASVQPGASISFAVQFSGFSLGNNSGVVHIHSDNCNVLDYDFAVQATVSCPLIGPEINLQGNGVDIMNYANPSAASLTDFGLVPLNSAIILTTPPATTVAPGSSTNFTIRFTPLTSGAFYDAVIIFNNDCDEHYFQFSIAGTGTAVALPTLNTWTGNISQVWEDVANWSAGILPDANTDVVIASARPHYPQLSSNVTIRTIKLNAGSTLIVNSGFSLTVLQ